MDIFLQHLVSGLMQGGVFALLSVGLALIFGVVRVINFAHADFMTLGMYAVIGLHAFSGIEPSLLALLALPAYAVFGWTLFRLLLSRSTASSEGSGLGGGEVQLLVTLGFSYVIQNLLLMFAGAGPRSILTASATHRVYLDELVSFDLARGIAFSMALGATLLLILAVKYLPFGRQVRAAADDPEAAAYVGINVKSVQAWAFGIGISMAALAGGVLVAYYPAEPFTGNDFVVVMFAAVILGGLGSIIGTFIGAMVLGLVQSFSLLVLPLQLQDVGVFVVFLILLQLRPDGLFGQRERVA